MASTPSSNPAEKRARVGDGSSSAAESIPADQSTWRDWANLESGPTWLIANRVLSGRIADYVCFRAACGAWRRCTDDPQADALDPRFHPRSWSMLPDVVANGHRPGCRYRYSRFKNDSTGEHIRMTIWGLNGQRGRTFLARTSQGLLVLLNKKTDAVLMVNPLTGASADLPPVTTLLAGYDRSDVFPRAGRRELDFPLCFGADLTSDSAVVINFGWHPLLGVARPGDERWTTVECEHRTSGLVQSFAGRVYCIVGETAMVVETSPDHPPRLANAAHNPFRSRP
ncbi:hypothetical protein ZWY2020_009572 [Hordeum vulgare]|nr:hypothetical protein ZWY2020_009572 [Hordeum vulgare]